MCAERERERERERPPVPRSAAASGAVCAVCETDALLSRLVGAPLRNVEDTHSHHHHRRRRGAPPLSLLRASFVFRLPSSVFRLLPLPLLASSFVFRRLPLPSSVVLLRSSSSSVVFLLVHRTDRSSSPDSSTCRAARRSTSWSRRVSETAQCVCVSRKDHLAASPRGRHIASSR